MKHILLIGAILLVSNFASFGQQTKTVVGKWRISKIVTPELTIDVDNPAVTRKELEKQIEAGSGQKASAEMIDQAMEGIMAGMKDSYFEFKADGKVKMGGAMNTGGTVDDETYTVDYKAGTITVVSKGNKKEIFNFKFVGNDLILDITEEGKKSVLTLKKYNKETLR